MPQIYDDEKEENDSKVLSEQSSHFSDLESQSNN